MNAFQRRHRRAAASLIKDDKLFITDSRSIPAIMKLPHLVGRFAVATRSTDNLRATMCKSPVVSLPLVNNSLQFQKVIIEVSLRADKRALRAGVCQNVIAAKR